MSLEMQVKRGPIMFLGSTDPLSGFFFQLVNNGPSNISQTVLELRCPLSFQGQRLLYPLEFSTKGPVNCTSDRTLNPLHLRVSLNLHTCVLSGWERYGLQLDSDVSLSVRGSPDGPPTPTSSSRLRSPTQETSPSSALKSRFEACPPRSFDRHCLHAHSFPTRDTPPHPSG